MKIVDTLSSLDLCEPKELDAYWRSETLERLYFLPKRIDAQRREACLHDGAFRAGLRDSLRFFASVGAGELCAEIWRRLEEKSGYRVESGTLTLLFGCGTTTIYTLGEETVLCAESLNGERERLEMLLAHEFAHLVRRAGLRRDIFSSCVGERLASEGLAENFAREMVPGRPDSFYCITDEERVRWTWVHSAFLESLLEDHREDAQRMQALFAGDAVQDFPVRTGYVYGYDAVRRSLERKGLTARESLTLDWHELLE